MPNWWNRLVSPGKKRATATSAATATPTAAPAPGPERNWRERPPIDPADVPGPGEIDALIWWLERQGPRELHRVAQDWNWDRSTRPLRYIVDRPDCDKGTALTIFYSGEPERFASHNPSGPYHRPDYRRYFQDALQPCDDDDLPEEEIWLLRRISENWSRGLYKRFDFYPGENAIHWLTSHPVQYRPNPSNMPWPVPADLVAAVPQGEMLDNWGYHEGFPVELCDAFDQRPDIHP